MTFRNNALQLLALCISLATSIGAQAGVVLDQSYLVANANPSTFALAFGVVGQATRPPGAPATLPAVVQFGGVQTFTAGTRGYLDRVGFQAQRLTGNGLLIATLVDGDALAGSTNVIASTSVSFGLLPSTGATLFAPSFFLEVRDADYLVDVGQRYSVVFEALVDPLARAGLLLATSPRSPVLLTGTNYDGGAFNATFFGVPASTIPGSLDVGFESYVDTIDAPVPAPATLPLLVIACAASWLRHGSRFALHRRGTAP